MLKIARVVLIKETQEGGNKYIKLVLEPYKQGCGATK